MKKITLKNFQKVNPNEEERRTKPLFKSNTIKKIDLAPSRVLQSLVDAVACGKEDRIAIYEDNSVFFQSRMGAVVAEDKDATSKDFKAKASETYEKDIYSFKKINFLNEEVNTKRTIVSQINIIPTPDSEYPAKVVLLLKVKSSKRREEITFYKDITKTLVKKHTVLDYKMEK